MGKSAALLIEPQSLVACTISRNVQEFELLIEDMQSVAGDRWGDLTFAEAAAFLDQPDADSLDFMALAIDAQDEANLGQVRAVIAAARAKGIRVILVAEDVTPAVLHQLLREGADDFIPYPLPEGELQRATSRPKAQGKAPAPAAPGAAPSPAAPGGHSGWSSRSTRWPAAPAARRSP
jgi:pilus assembly protein CpaE